MSGNKSALSVVVAGGGTAGHIEPALAVADAVKAAAPDTRNHCARDGAWSRNHLGAGSRVHARAHSPGSASS